MRTVSSLSVAALATLVLAGCPATDPHEEQVVDAEVGDVDATAEWSLVGDRDDAVVTYLLDEVTAAETGLMEVALHARLSEVADIDQDADPQYWTHALVEGDIFDVELVIDGVTYETDPAPRTGELLEGPAPLRNVATNEVVGILEGDLNFYVLDASGYDFTTHVRWAMDPLADPDELEEWPGWVSFDPVQGSFDEE